jgi:hypothetical protein
MGRLAVLLAALLLTAGCGGARADAVGEVATDFYAAARAGDGVRACALLAPATRHEVEQSADAPCATAVLDSDIPDAGDPVHVDVYGRQAQVRFGADTAFLADLPDGWKVVAVACTARGEQPYDCQVKGA